jgi:hypothetical protein
MALAAISAGSSIQASDIRLGRLLQEHGLINAYQFFDALQAQAANGGRLGPILVRRGCLSDQQLTHVLAERHAHLHVVPHEQFSLAPVPADQVLLPGAMSLCLSLTVHDNSDPGAFACGNWFATMPIMLPAEASDWLVAAKGRHAADRFELISEEGAALNYDLAVRPLDGQDLFPLVAGGASAVYLTGRPASSNPVHAVVEACIAADAMIDVPAGHYVEYIDLAISHPDCEVPG